ncbi:solute carrier family 22 member hypothetical protein [Limosa lapponica baueri]|uniref:Uncharacterized protein n=1 Tax=Limosa lapponica baueri TaxID=1758121 RepID=A0A2I0TQ08_LIMLA|nr:solute carrier family 22 member hypothetical protein [Limosa lapponica baueri]
MTAVGVNGGNEEAGAQVIPESARWLVTKGRIEEAKKALQKAASVNKRTIPPGLLEQVPLKIHLVTCSIPLYLNFRFADSLVYYGLSLNVTGFGLDVYLTQLAFGAVELPARLCCIFLLQWFGRKKSQAVLLLLSGLMCLVITGIPEGEQSLPIPRAQPGGAPASSILPQIPSSQPSWLQTHICFEGLRCLKCRNPRGCTGNVLASSLYDFLLLQNCAWSFHSS